MRQQIFKRCSVFIFLLGILLVSISCSGQSKTKITDYDKLCQIYKEIVPLKMDLHIKEMKLNAKVQKELPDFFKSNFVYIEKSDANKRYGFIKRLAEEANKQKWDCEVMKQYYATEFK